jgi:hypothetical protein
VAGSQENRSTLGLDQRRAFARVYYTQNILYVRALILIGKLTVFLATFSPAAL